MSSHDDLEYYRARALQERELAKAASDQRAAAIHAALAARYEALVAKGERPMGQILTPNFQKRSATARRHSQGPDAAKIER